ncbi:MAG: hypothetical protein L0219_05225 [Phycisphaerales bacterium]|nr:hypothetical protein [Phycisphaerales bacterium]
MHETAPARYGSWIAQIIRPLLVFEIAMALAMVFLLDPLVIALLQAIVTLSGNPYSGNTALIAFFLSPVGLLTVVTTGVKVSRHEVDLARRVIAILRELDMLDEVENSTDGIFQSALIFPLFLNRRPRRLTMPFLTGCSIRPQTRARSITLRNVQTPVRGGVRSDGLRLDHPTAAHGLVDIDELGQAIRLVLRMVQRGPEQLVLRNEYLQVARHALVEPLLGEPRKILEGGNT